MVAMPLKLAFRCTALTVPVTVVLARPGVRPRAATVAGKYWPVIREPLAPPS